MQEGYNGRMRSYPTIIEDDVGICVPDLHIYGVGDNREDAIRLAREAITFWFESWKEEEDGPVPTPSSIAEVEQSIDDEDFGNCEVIMLEPADWEFE